MKPALPLIALAALLAVLVTAGCGVSSPGRHAEPDMQPRDSADKPAPASPVESLLVYFGYVRKLGAADLAREHDMVRQRYTTTRSDFDRVRYAMLLSVPGAAFNDDARALETLEPLLRNHGAQLHHLAFMVSAQVQEQRRGQGLQQKLEALRLLEKSLIERDTGAGKRK